MNRKRTIKNRKRFILIEMLRKINRLYWETLHIKEKINSTY